MGGIRKLRRSIGKAKKVPTVVVQGRSRGSKARDEHARSIRAAIRETTSLGRKTTESVRSILAAFALRRAQDQSGGES